MKRFALTSIVVGMLLAALTVPCLDHFRRSGCRAQRFDLIAPTSKQESTS